MGHTTLTFYSNVVGTILNCLLLIPSIYSTDLGIAYIGKYNLSDFQEGGPVRPVVARYPAPGYIDNSTGLNQWTNDVAILKLDRAPANPIMVTLNKDPNFPNATGTPLLALGWGSTTNGITAPLTRSAILQQGEENYISDAQCAVAKDPITGAAFGLSVTDTALTADWLCTLGPVSHPCKGDSGGPILQPGAAPRYDLLVGVISR